MLTYCDDFFSMEDFDLEGLLTTFDGQIIIKIEKDENQSREQQQQGPLLAFFLRQRQAPCRDEVYKIRM